MATKIITDFTPITETIEFKPLKKQVSNIVSDFSPTKVESEKRPGFFEDIKAHWPRYAGATLGAIAGAPAALPGMIAGATIGGAAGEAYQTLGEYLGAPKTAPKTSMEAAERIGMAGFKEGVTEFAGGMAFKAIGKVLAPFTKTITEEGKLAFDTLKQYMPKVKAWTKPISTTLGKKTPALLPAEMTQHRGLDLLHNIAEGSAIGGRKIATFKDVTRERAIGSMIEDLAESFGKQVDPDTLGNTIADIALDRYKEFKKIYTTPLYNTVEELTKGTIEKVPIKELVPTSLVDSSGKPIMKEVIKLVEKEVGGAKIPLKYLKDSIKDHLIKSKVLGSIEAKNAGDDIVRAISELPDVINFATAQDLRTRLLSIVDEFSIVNKKAPALRVANRLRNQLDQSITNALKQQNPEAHEIWREANRLYKYGAKKYNNRFIRSLIRKADPDFGGEPEKVLQMIFKNGGISGLTKVKNIMPKGEWEQLQSWYVRDLLSKATTVKGNVSGPSMLKRMFGTSGMGRQGMGIIFNQKQIQALRNVGITLKTIQERQAEGSGGMLIQLMQGGAITAMFFGQVSKAQVAIIAGPEIASRMMLNPIMSKWLSQGLAMPIGSKFAPSLLLRLSGAADKIQKELNREETI